MAGTTKPSRSSTSSHDWAPCQARFASGLDRESPRREGWDDFGVFQMATGIVTALQFGATLACKSLCSKPRSSPDVK
jgi:hypothetical protein